MKIKTRCGHCGKVYNMSADFAGKTAQCKQCHNNFVMAPMPEGPPAAAQQTQPPPPRRQPPYDPPAQSFQPQQPLDGERQPPFEALPGHQLSQGGMPNPYHAPPPPNPFANQAQGGPHPGAQTQLPRAAGQQPPRAGARPAEIEPSLQTIVCPKCRFTAGIPPVTGKMRLRCQECGHVFAVKPDPKFKNLIKQATKGRVKGDGGPKVSITLLALLFVIALAVAILFVGPTVLPGVIPKLLPF